MTNVDSRIVTMKFDNKQFEQAASTTMQTLDKLKTGLKFEGATKGMADIQAMAGKFDFAPMSAGIDHISAKFMALSTIAITALSNITSQVMATGAQTIKSLTLDPVMQGFSEYEMKMGAIQTIMAGSGESMDVVNQKLQELNTYSDQTIYSFADMTQNIGKFTNAGVSLDQSVASIKGIANVAALSGANAEEASRSMYNFAQALSSGSVKLMDWKSIELANMATVEFKEELIASAVAAGTLTKSADGMYKTLEGTPVSATKGFNESLQDQWLTSEALVATLGRYSDATTDIGKRATAAATEVKTFSQLMDTLREAAGSGWATTSEIIIGNFEEAKALWTSVNNVVGGIIGAQADARNKMLQDWKDLGGRTVLLEALTNLVHAVSNLLKPIKEAFREIFPRKTGQQLYDMTVAFKNFTDHLVIQPEIMDAIKSLAKGLFAVFSIIHQFSRLGWKIIAAVFDALTTGSGAASGGILQLLAKVADIISAFDAWLKEGDRLKNILDKIAAVIAYPIRMIGELVKGFIDLARGDPSPFLDKLTAKFEAAGPLIQKLTDKFQILRDFINKFSGKAEDLFNFGDAEGSADKIDVVNAALTTTTNTLDTISKVWNAVVKSFKATGDFLAPIIDKIWEGLKKLKTNIGKFLDDISMLDILSVAGGGFFLSFFLGLKKMMGGFTEMMENISNTFENVSGVLEQTTANLKAMEKDVKATAILKIAVALLLLAVALTILSKLDMKEIGVGLGAIAVMLAALTGAMAALNKWAGDSMKDAAKLVIISASIMILAFALLALSAAVAIFGNMETGVLAQGLLSIGVILLGLAGLSKLFDMAGGDTEFRKMAISLTILSVALLILAAAIRAYDALNAGTLVQGLGTIGIILLALVGMSKLFSMAGGGTELIKVAAALLIFSIALDAFAATLLIYDQLNATTLLDSFWKVALIIGGLIGAAKLLGGTTAGKLVALAGALILFSIALNMMVPALWALGKMSFGEIAAALGILAGIFIILGVVATTVGSAIVTFMLGLAASIFLLGLSMLAIGGGMMMFAAGLASLAISGAAGAAVLIALLVGIIKLIPMLLTEIADGFVEFMKHIADRSGELKDAWVTILTNMLDAFIEITPKFLEAMTTLILGLIDVIIVTIPKWAEAFTLFVETAIDTITNLFPKIVKLGLDMILTLLKGIRDNIYQITTVAIDIIREFLRAIRDRDDQIADEGFKTIISFINALSKAIDENADELGTAGRKLGKSLVEGLVTALIGKDAVNKIKNAAKELASHLPGPIKKLLGIDSPSKVFMEFGKNIVEGLVVGMAKNEAKASDAADNLGRGVVDGMNKAISDVVDNDINVNPTITPVLDLTQVRKEASTINKVLSPDTISAMNSYNQAALISANTFTKDKDISTPEATPSTLVNFEQNNYSPKALSSVDIYRQTKNQLSLAKEALKI